MKMLNDGQRKTILRYAELLELDEPNETLLKYMTFEEAKKSILFMMRVAAVYKSEEPMTKPPVILTIVYRDLKEKLAARGTKCEPAYKVGDRVFVTAKKKDGIVEGVDDSRSTNYLTSGLSTRYLISGLGTWLEYELEPCKKTIAYS